MKKVIFIIAAVLLVGGATASVYVKNIYQKIVVVSPRVSLPFFNPTTPTPTPDPLAPYSVLILGYGGPNHDGGYLTDTMIIARIVPHQKKVYLISLPRDLWFDLPIKGSETESHKINSAYAIGNDDRRYKEKPVEFTGRGGGGTLAKYASGLAVGFPIDYFIAVSFDGFEKSIDVLGGADVVVPHTFDDFLYPIPSEKENSCGKTPEEIDALTATISATLIEKEFPCRYEHIHFDQGVQHMDGNLALKFVRSRKSETYGGDFNRSIRQQALITAVKQKVISLNFIPKIFPFISTLTSDLQTDIDASVFGSKLKTTPDLTSFKIDTINISSEELLKESKSEDGQYILLPTSDWETIHRFINSKFSE